jgi:ABC-type multidrug transport system permease subunit
MKRFWVVFVARNLEFFRDTSSLGWNIIFPVLLIFGFAFAFNGSGQSAYKVGVFGDTAVKPDIMSYQHIQFIPYTNLPASLSKLTHHQLDMVLDLPARSYYINTESSTGYLLEKILHSSTNTSLERKVVTGKVVRYVDWFVPGVLGMNILFGCLFGVGYVIVRYRQNGVLKRFKATPLRSIEFITAQLLSRFIIVLFFSVVTFVGTDFFLHFQMNGNYLDLLIVTALAILCMVSLGLLFSTRFKSEELAGGVMNLVTFPMMLLSGIFFSLEGTPKVMQDAALALPITHFVNAARAIMIDGAGLAAVWGNLAVLALMTAGFLALSAVLFKWE